MKQIQLLFAFFILLSFSSMAQEGNQEWEVQLREANKLFQENQVDKALEQYRKAAQEAEKSFGKNSYEYGYMEYYTGAVYKSLERYSEAIPHLTKALPLLEKAKGKESKYYEQALYSLAGCQYKTGDNLNAEKSYLELLPLTEKVHGKYSMAKGEVLKEMDDFYYDTYQKDKMNAIEEKIVSYYKECISYYESQKGNNDKNVYELYFYFGEWLMKVGRNKEAGDAFARSGSICKTLMGEKSIEFFNVCWFAGLSYNRALDYSSSVKWYEAAYPQVKSHIAAGSLNQSDALQFLEDYANSLDGSGQLEKSLAVLNEAIAGREKNEVLLNNKKYIAELDHAIAILSDLKKTALIDEVYEKKLKALEMNTKEYTGTLAKWGEYFNHNDITGQSARVEKACVGYLQYKQSRSENDLQYADAIYTLGRINLNDKKYEKSIKNFNEALPIVEQKAGKETIFYIQVLSALGEAQILSKLYNSGTEKLFAEIVSLSRKVHLPEYPSRYSTAIQLVVEYYLNNDKNTAAEDLLIEAVKTLQPTLGWDDKEVVMLTSALRGIVKRTGHQEKIAFLPEFSEQQQKTLLNELGVTEGMNESEMVSQHIAKGEYPQALALFEKNYNVITAYFTGKKDYTTLVQMDGLMAKYYRDIGEYGRSEQLLLRSAEYAKKYLSEKDEVYITTLANIAEFYLATGAYKSAQEYYLKALGLVDLSAMDKKAKDDMYYNLLFKVAKLDSRMGFYENAEKYINEVGDYYYERYGKESIEYAHVLAALARIYAKGGSYYDAERLFRMALPAAEKYLDHNTPDYAGFLTGLAYVYQVSGSYAKAEPLYEKSLSILSQTWGRKSRSYLNILADAALLYTDMGRYDKAAILFKELNETNLYQINNFFPALSEKEKTDFYNTVRSDFDQYNAFVLKSGMNTGEMYDLQLITKGLLFRSTRKVQSSILSSSDSSTIKAYKAWQNKKDQLGKVYRMSASEKQAAGINEKKLEEEINALEKTLTSKSQLFGKSIASSASGWRDIQKSLKPGEAAVEMVRVMEPVVSYTFEYFGKGMFYDTLGEKGQCKISDILSDRTAAHRAGLRPGDLLIQINGQATAGKSMRELGDMIKNETLNLVVQQFEGGKKVNMSIKSDSAFKRNMEKKVRYVALFILPGQAAPEMAVLSNGEELEGRYAKYYQNMIRIKGRDELSYLQYWDKIARRLQGATRVYFSADGIYNTINLNTLYHSSSGKYLLEEANIRLVGNTSEITGASGSKLVMNNTSATLLGYPDYYASSTGTGKQGNEQTQVSYSMLKSDTSQRFMSGNKVSELPGTKAEIEKIESTLKTSNVKVMKHISLSASEENIKKLNSPSILHIATHGFFLDKNVSAASDERGITGVSNDLLRKNPLFRSGLLLAGAGNTISGTSPGSSEDGILTAYEAMNLSLENTQLIVLSACETGLGEIRHGEGVYGLQRSFKAAGAKTVLMSLWKVNDAATQQLMTEFYSNLAATGDKYESFRKAQLKLKESFPDPYYWGAFVMVGE